MADPIGELEELIAQALEAGPTRALAPREAAEWLAGLLAPQVVLRSQLEHVGWVHSATEFEADDSYVWSGPTPRAVFAIPARTVSGSTLMVLGGAMGGAG